MKNIPFLLSSIISNGPPCDAEITGMPAENASIITMPKGSGNVEADIATSVNAHATFLSKMNPVKVNFSLKLRFLFCDVTKIA